MTTLDTMIYTQEQLSSIVKTRIPKHIAIIPDGNRRWAKNHSKSYLFGHSTGANTLIRTVKAAKELGVKAVTFYLFSTENWNRSQLEISGLMHLLKQFLNDHCEEMQKNGVRLQTIGDLSKFPESVIKTVKHTCEATQNNHSIDMIMALNYGGRDDITRAVQKIMKEHYNQKIDQIEITEKLISSYLDTAPWGDPDLLIRSSGEMRLSNFLLWQISYSEMYVTDVLWPDFDEKELLKAIALFQLRNRRLGE